MKIGYPCLNYSINAQANKTFRLASYTDERFLQTAQNNIDSLEKILKFNLENGLMFFRISSEIFPFASHPVLKVDWEKQFSSQLKRIGNFINEHHMRISMHPDQFVLINSPRQDVVAASIRDLEWHARLLDCLGLDQTAKVQIHVGGLYADRQGAMNAFIANFKKLPTLIKRRLVIENDDNCFSLSDCLKIYKEIGIPIIFDNFHHECLNCNELMIDAIKAASKTWTKKDGVLMTDYSYQQTGAIKGKHADTLDPKRFQEYLEVTKSLDFDIMLEIKDKEKSAIKALDIIRILKSDTAYA